MSVRDGGSEMSTSESLLLMMMMIFGLVAGGMDVGNCGGCVVRCRVLVDV